MEKQRNTDRLAGYLIKLGELAIIVALCWYLRSVLIYIALAFVVSLLGHPVVRMLKKIQIKKKSAPDWLLAILALIIVLGVLLLVLTQLIPVVSKMIDEASLMNFQLSDMSLLDTVNQWLIELFPVLGEDFNVVTYIMGLLKGLVNMNGVTDLVGSVASLVINVVVVLFSVIFIAFFFLKDANLFENLICAFVPEGTELKMKSTLNEIKQLLSRYFVGLLLETLGVALLDFLGLWLVAQMSFGFAVGIAFIAGLLNIIPYVGPVIGEVIGVVLGLVWKFGTGGGLDVNILVFGLIVLAIMLAVQLVDNFVYQPLIYSTSIKAHPLEIFIVFLVAGEIGGVVGMLVAIPVYTVVRIIAVRFFYRFKPIQRLVPDLSEEDKIIENIH